MSTGVNQVITSDGRSDRGEPYIVVRRLSKTFGARTRGVRTRACGNSPATWIGSARAKATW